MRNILTHDAIFHSFLHLFIHYLFFSAYFLPSMILQVRKHGKQHTMTQPLKHEAKKQAWTQTQTQTSTQTSMEVYYLKEKVPLPALFVSRQLSLLPFPLFAGSQARRQTGKQTTHPHPPTTTQPISYTGANFSESKDQSKSEFVQRIQGTQSCNA